MKFRILFFALSISTLASASAYAAPVPSYVPPVSYQEVPDYADETRGVFVPSHGQQRMLTEKEQQLMAYNMQQRLQQTNEKDIYDPGNMPQQLNTLVGQVDYANELDRIAQRQSMLEGGSATDIEPQAGPVNPFNQYAQVQTQTTAGGLVVPQGYPTMPMQPMVAVPVMPQQPMAQPMMVQPQAMQPVPMQADPQTAYRMEAPQAGAMAQSGGYDMTGVSTRNVDMHNSRVSLNEERITIRRALQRMMDQIGAGDWVVVWDLAEQNGALPDMEIAIQANEPFIDVLNALLARAQARSGQPLRVVKYDKTQRLVITDRANSMASAGLGGTSSIGAGGAQEAVVTENVLKESVVSLHYDEIPLVDALENIIHQAGKGQWRLRVYAGTDQVLKPAHIEEPLGIALERLLKLFNLKYEVFPGGKLIVITNNDRFGYSGF